jgi:hypothetical protein
LKTPLGRRLKFLKCAPIGVQAKQPTIFAQDDIHSCTLCDWEATEAWQQVWTVTTLRPRLRFVKLTAALRTIARRSFHIPPRALLAHSTGDVRIREGVGILGVVGRGETSLTWVHLTRSEVGAVLHRLRPAPQRDQN